MEQEQYIGSVVLREESLSPSVMAAVFLERGNIFTIQFYTEEGELFDTLSIRATADEKGIFSDLDRWKMRCLELSAELCRIEEDMARAGT